VFAANAHYVFANLRAWGWITLILGALQLLAAAGVWAGNQLARWFADPRALPIAAGIVAYETHASRHPGPQRTRQPSRRVRDADGCSPVVSSQAAAPGGRGRAR
jgi:hypothetical protein